MVPGKPDQVLLEPSSGNTGIALALVCRLRGYHLKVVLPDNVSPERRQLLGVYGAEIIDSPGAEGSNGAVRLARGLAIDHPEWVFLYQYANPANPAVALPHDGPRDPGGLPRGHPLRRGARHDRHARRRRHVPEGARRRRAGLGGRAARRRARRRAAQPRRRLRAAGVHRRGRRGAPRPSRRGAARGSPSSGRVASPSSACSSGCPRVRRWRARPGAPRACAEGDDASIVVLSADDGWKYLSSDAWGGDLDDVVERASHTIYF